MSGHNLDFTKTEHAQVAPNIDPTGVRLPPNFSVCILGASRGIGASIAYAYALAGADTLILAARSAMDLQDVTEKCRSLRPTISVCCEICDIVSSASVEALALRIKQSPLSRIDVVIVNSGFAGPIISRVTEGDPADWQRCMNVNTLGTYHAAHYLIPLFLDTSRGARSFVVISASAAWITEGTIANYGYCISRLAQLRLVEMIARQYSAEGLLSVGVHPGAVRTEMAEKAPEEFLECELYPRCLSQ